MRSEEIRRIQKEVDEAGSDLYNEVLWYKEHDYENSHKLARMAHSHMLSAYLELMNAIELMEKMEDIDE